jgi:hypothetical protein
MSMARIQAPHTYLAFDGVDDYVEIPSAPSLSIDPQSGFTVAVWMRPDTLTFPNAQGTGYVYWAGKGEGTGTGGQQEWAFRMYNLANNETPPRPNRISFYVFNPAGGEGVGSYFQDPTQPVVPHVWAQFTATVDPAHGRTALYRDGVFLRCDHYAGRSDSHCGTHPLVITPAPGTAPLRLGTRDFQSYFQGGLSRLRCWNRLLSHGEIQQLYQHDTVPQPGPVAEYLANEGSGSVLHDTIGGNDGQIVGATWHGSPD